MSAPSSLALVIVIVSSLSSVSISMSDKTEAREASPILAPALLMTSYSALSIAVLTPASAVLDPVTSSAMRGSIRGVYLIKVPSALAARVLNVSLDGSARDLANVRWS